MAIKKPMKSRKDEDEDEVVKKKKKKVTKAVAEDDDADTDSDASDEDDAEGDDADDDDDSDLDVDADGEDDDDDESDESAEDDADAEEAEEDDEDEDVGDEDEEEDDADAEDDSDEDDTEDAEADSEEDEDSDLKDKSSWMFTGEAAKKAVERAQKENRSFKPEFYFGKKETRSKLVRVLDPKPIAVIFQHNLKMRQGSMPPFQSETCSGEDCEYCNQGLRKAARYIYVVNSLTPFKTKKNKTISCQQLFMLLPEQRHNVLQKVFGKIKGAVKDWIIEVTREGSGFQTTWTFWPERKSSPKPEEKALKSIAKDLKTHYAPLDSKAQKKVIARAVLADEMSED